jgi:hypothetical protein
LKQAERSTQVEASNNRFTFTREAFESLEFRGGGQLVLGHGRAGALPCGHLERMQGVLAPLQGKEAELPGHGWKEES